MKTAVPMLYDGVQAMYLPHETRVLCGLMDMADAGVVEREKAIGQVKLLHGLKAMLGATILDDDDPWRDPPKTPIEQSSEAS